MTRLLAVPNLSEGRDHRTLDAIADAFAPPAGPVRLLDRHADVDHHRAVYTLAGPPGRLAEALLAGARAAIGSIDLATPRGLHPFVGAVDIVPIVHLRDADRGAAVVEALLVADLLASELGLPVFLYGELAAGRTRADIRRGGVQRLRGRIEAGELTPDFGPSRLHPTAGAVLVGARPPLVAFNLELAPPADLDTVRRIAALIREGGPEGLPGVRAIGLTLASRKDRAQVSMNIENAQAMPLANVIAAVANHAAIAAAELVGLAPRAAFDGFPQHIPIPNFDASRHIIENALEPPRAAAPSPLPDLESAT